MGADNVGELETMISKEAKGRRIVLDLKDLSLWIKTLSVFLRAAKRTA